MPSIVSGRLGGRALRVPKSVTRPTSARVREALFDLLEHRGDLGAGHENGDGRHPWSRGGRVVDMFAGSGALGFEAWSRGAGEVVFVESDRAACGVIRDNAATLGVTDFIRLVQGRLPNAVSRLQGVFDLVLMDPPYAKWSSSGKVVAKLVEKRLVADGAVVALEVPARELFDGKVAIWPDWGIEEHLVPVSARRWGDTGVVIWRFVGYRARVEIPQ